MSNQNQDQYAHDYDSVHNRNYLTERFADKEGAFFLPYLKPGMSLLDCGCGPGTITVGLAQAVSPGEVVALDIEPVQLEAARKNAEKNNITNMKFEVGDNYNLPFPDNSFDAVYSNTVMGHLTSPLDGIKEIYRVLKPGGVAGIRDGDLGNHLHWPTNEVIDRGLALYFEFRQRGKKVTNIGRQLRSLMIEAGFDRVIATSSAETYGTLEGTRLFGGVLAGELQSEGFVNSGLMTQEEIEEAASALNAWGENPDAVYQHTFFEVVGWKP